MRFWMCWMKKVITEQKQKLAAELAEASFQSSVSTAELRFAVRALKRLGDGPRAHTLIFVIASPAASGCLRPVAESVHISLGHCSLLEAHGLTLSPVLLKIFRPCVEQALYANIKRIEQCTAAHAAADDWSPTYPPTGSRSLGTASLAGVIASQPKLSSSAHRFNTMVQELCEDISPLEILQLSEQTLEGVMQVFNAYIGMLIKALPGSVDNENLEGSVNRIVRMAETEPEQISLLANALLLADELIPRAAAKLSSSQQSNKTDDTSKRSTDRQSRPVEQRELKRRLQRLVDQLRDSFYFANYLVSDIIPEDLNFQQRKKFLHDVKNYFWDEPYLFRWSTDNTIRRCVLKVEMLNILQLEDGDIICFQKFLKAESQQQFCYPDVPSFLEYVHDRQLIYCLSMIAALSSLCCSACAALQSFSKRDVGAAY
ncbi:Exocyst complex component EXO84A [Capsicum chinense]|nr:Exocyst complex component EXO84A [Capsicum chinense]